MDENKISIYLSLRIRIIKYFNNFSDLFHKNIIFYYYFYSYDLNFDSYKKSHEKLYNKLEIEISWYHYISSLLFLILSDSYNNKKYTCVSQIQLELIYFLTIALSKTLHV